MYRHSQSTELLLALSPLRVVGTTQETRNWPHSMGVGGFQTDGAGSHCSEAKLEVMASPAPTLAQGQGWQMGEGTGHASVGVAGLLFCVGVHRRGQAILLAFQPLAWIDGKQEGWRGGLVLGPPPRGQGSRLPRPCTYGSILATWTSPWGLLECLHAVAAGFPQRKSNPKEEAGGSFRPFMTWFGSDILPRSLR